MQDCLPHVEVCRSFLVMYDIPLINGVSEMVYNSAVVFMLQIFFICVQINLNSLSVYFGRLFSKASASLFVS